jgi:hypothetical protein
MRRMRRSFSGARPRYTFAPSASLKAVWTLPAGKHDEGPGAVPVARTTYLSGGELFTG